MTRRIPRGLTIAPRTAVLTAAAAALCLAVIVPSAVASSASTTTRPTRPAATQARKTASKPTIVLVHGAFADASGWSAEIRYLTAHGYPVIAPANPLRGLLSDASAIRGVLATIHGPVVLVGHSYGGAVITNAAIGAPNVKALVYVSAFLPKKGESASHFTDPKFFPGSLLSNKTLLFRPIHNALAPHGKDVDVYINPVDFRAIFAGDQSRTKAAVLAAEQRPVAGFAYYQPSGRPAWAKLPSWDLISLNDKAIPPAAQEFMAKRAHAHVLAIHSAHDSLISHPGEVDKLIVEAAHSIN
jgi:pimeloyl-ACP methyl ester carboxylesterase